MIRARLVMTSLADRTIAALRANHDELAALVPTLSADQLVGPSGASEWTVAQVLSHLGSGAEIGLAGYQSAIAGTPSPPPDFNQTVWDRWNALTPKEQADGFVEHNASLVAELEALTHEQRETLKIELGFLPFPLPVTSLMGMRLNEAAQHAWDVEAGLDPTATIPATAADLIAEHLAGGLSFLLGFTGKADALPHSSVVGIGDSGLTLSIGDGVSLAAAGATTTATFTGSMEAAVRLIGGRLTPKYTPDGVAVTGNVTLEDLRHVFPGF